MSELAGCWVPASLVLLLVRTASDIEVKLKDDDDHDDDRDVDNIETEVLPAIEGGSGVVTAVKGT